MLILREQDALPKTAPLPIGIDYFRLTPDNFGATRFYPYLIDNYSWKSANDLCDLE